MVTQPNIKKSNEIDEESPKNPYKSSYSKDDNDDLVKEASKLLDRVKTEYKLPILIIKKNKQKENDPISHQRQTNSIFNNQPKQNYQIKSSVVSQRSRVNTRTVIESEQPPKTMVLHKSDTISSLKEPISVKIEKHMKAVRLILSQASSTTKKKKSKRKIHKRRDKTMTNLKVTGFTYKTEEDTLSNYRSVRYKGSPYIK